MTLLDKLSTIINYYNKNIRVGHTTAMKLGTDNVASIIVCLNTEHARYHQQGVQDPDYKTISLDNLDKLYGQSLPLVIEHGAVQSLLAECSREIYRLSEIEQKYNILVNKRN